jgi:hypothetical protein
VFEGPGDNMYGLEVCKSLNLPNEFLELANDLRIMRCNTEQSIINLVGSKYNAKKLKGKCEMCGKKGTEMHHLQHQQHADTKGNIGTFHKNHPANLINVCEECHLNFHKENKHDILHKH